MQSCLQAAWAWVRPTCGVPVLGTTWRWSSAGGHALQAGKQASYQKRRTAGLAGNDWEGCREEEDAEEEEEEEEEETPMVVGSRGTL
jgi:hypothetical protein